MARDGSADTATDIGETFKLARRKPLNFALLVSQDKKQGLVLETHHKKPPATLRRSAKRNGGGPKGASGVMTVSGKVVEMQCEDENVPGILPKLAKKHFAAQGYNFKFVFVLPGGQTIGEDDDEAEDESVEAGAAPGEAAVASEEAAPAAAGAPDAADADAEAAEAPAGARGDAQRDKLMTAFRAMNQPLKAALASAEPPVRKRLGTLAKTFGTEIKGDDMRRAAAVLQLLSTTLDQARAGGAGAPAGAAAEGAGTAAEAGPDPALEQRRAGRLAQLDELERNVDALLTQFASQEVG